MKTAWANSHWAVYSNSLTFRSIRVGYHDSKLIIRGSRYRIRIIEDHDIQAKLRTHLNRVLGGRLMP
jgi:hypothetical protein